LKLLIVINNKHNIRIMRGQTVRFILILIIGSILLLTATLKQEGVYAQNSTKTTTNATVLSDEDTNGIILKADYKINLLIIMMILQVILCFPLQ
jgi:hypothetical protein